MSSNKGKLRGGDELIREVCPALVLPALVVGAVRAGDLLLYTGSRKGQHEGNYKELEGGESRGAM